MASGRAAWTYACLEPVEAGPYDRDDFRRFCQRQAARSEAIARAGYRRYVDRCLKLALADDLRHEVSIEQRGYTCGGSTSHRPIEEGD